VRNNCFKHDVSTVRAALEQLVVLSECGRNRFRDVRHVRVVVLRGGMIKKRIS
jgi:hypothetical protein